MMIIASCNSGTDSESISDPNGTSPLQETMRGMYDYFDLVKKELAEGKTIEEVAAFEHIMTDRPTEHGKNTTTAYKTMAASYFAAINQMNIDPTTEAYNAIVQSCMDCHQQVCPGPMVRIKKLYL